MNTAPSVKDKIGVSMVEIVEAKDLIIPGKTILVEPTSGNTRIA
jgi:cysteine synthase A